MWWSFLQCTQWRDPNILRHGKLSLSLLQVVANLFFLSFISRSDLLTRFIALSLSHTVLLSAVTVKSKLHPNFAKSKENYKIYFLSTHPTNRAQTLIKNRPNRIDRDLTLQSNKGLSGIFMPKNTLESRSENEFFVSWN